MLPTKDTLYQNTLRGGRVFLFTYPDKNPGNPGAGVFLPADEALETITSKLLELPGCKEVGGPFFNATVAITIDDQDEQAGKMSDQEWCQLIAQTIYEHWLEEFEVKWVHTGKFEALYRVLAKSQEEANDYVENHRLELDPEEVLPLSDDYEQYL